MTLLLAFAVTLFVASLISGVAQRTVLSTAVLFLLVGFFLGRPVLDLLNVSPTDSLVNTLAQLALFSVLYTDGMRAGIRDLADAWQLPGRALLLGLPIALALTAILGNVLLGLPWVPALLLAAALAPTDPVFARALMGQESVPLRLRRLLNVESGLNDGLALPIILLTLNFAHTSPVSWNTILANLVLGVVVGIVIPAVALGTTRYLSLPSTEPYKPLAIIAIGLLVLAVGLQTQVNLFLAAFAAGITVASIDPDCRDDFQPFGEVTTELLKLATLLLFGALISLEVVGNEFDVAEYVFVALVLLAVRPLALTVALRGSELSPREWMAVAWFGPKGFASMVYGLLILKSGIDQGNYLFHLIAFIVGLSIIAHSSTDVVVARWFQKGDERNTANAADSSAAGS